MTKLFVYKVFPQDEHTDLIIDTICFLVWGNLLVGSVWLFYRSLVYCFFPSGKLVEDWKSAESQQDNLVKTATFKGGNWGFTEASDFQHLPWSVSSVTHGGQAAEAGVRVGDVITHVDARAINEANVQEIHLCKLRDINITFRTFAGIMKPAPQQKKWAKLLRRRSSGLTDIEEKSEGESEVVKTQDPAKLSKQAQNRVKQLEAELASIKTLNDELTKRAQWHCPICATSNPVSTTPITDRCEGCNEARYEIADLEKYIAKIKGKGAGKSDEKYNQETPKTLSELASAGKIEQAVGREALYEVT